jgi:hypothetical protein
MVSILKSKGHARKIYVSPYSDICTKFTDRDLEDEEGFLQEEDDIKGDTEGRFLLLLYALLICLVLTYSVIGFTSLFGI